MVVKLILKVMMKNQIIKRIFHLMKVKKKKTLKRNLMIQVIYDLTFKLKFIDSDEGILCFFDSITTSFSSQSLSFK